MRHKLTNNQMSAVSDCGNDYLKMLYITDFLFNKEKTKYGYFRVLKETNKTSNINVKKFYLYLTCKFNLKKELLFLENAIGNISLDDCEKKEIDDLSFIDIYEYGSKDQDDGFIDTIKTKRKKEIIKSIGRN